MNVKKKFRRIKEGIIDAMKDGTLKGYAIVTSALSVAWSLFTLFTSGSILDTIIAIVIDEAIYMLGFILFITIVELTSDD